MGLLLRKVQCCIALQFDFGSLPSSWCCLTLLMGNRSMLCAFARTPPARIEFSVHPAAVTRTHTPAHVPCHCRHDAPGLVSLLVKEVNARPVTERLVAMGGRLVTIKEQAGEAPNGSAFAITTAPAPELDASNLVVGQVRDLGAGDLLLMPRNSCQVHCAEPTGDNTHSQGHH